MVPRSRRAFAAASNGHGPFLFWRRICRGDPRNEMLLIRCASLISAEELEVVDVIVSVYYERTNEYVAKFGQT